VHCLVLAMGFQGGLDAALRVMALVLQVWVAFRRGAQALVTQLVKQLQREKLVAMAMMRRLQQQGLALRAGPD